MPRAAFSFIKVTAKLKGLLSIRARLVLIALILTVPLMIDRVRELETSRTNQIRTASGELVELARRGAEAHREAIATVQGLLRTAARLHANHTKQGDPCGLFRNDFRFDLAWISSFSVVSKDGRIQCSTTPKAVGLDVSDRPYFHEARDSRGFVLSDYVISRAQQQPTVIAAMAVAAVDETQTDVVLAPVSLAWLKRLTSAVSVRPGTALWLIDGRGSILTGRASDESQDGRELASPALQRRLLVADEGLETVPGSNGRNTLYAFVRVPGTQARLVVSVGEDTVLGAIDRNIRYAYLQLAAVCALILLGAWLVGEHLIIKPIRLMAAAANQFGLGDLSSRVGQKGLPLEFDPLARAFNGMAEQLAERERDLRANNNRLTVLATIDAVSGLANRRGFESRLDFEWLRAIETGQPLGLLMIDVDHFKLFNDTYGHPEGDVCLRRIGDALTAIASTAPGFAARYGGEEFLMLLPGADAVRSAQVGDQIRQAIEELGISHAPSIFGHVTVSVGAAALRPAATTAIQTLIDAADAGLYAAKGRGRNQVVVHGAIERAVDTAAPAATVVPTV
jgi:diguanylate cyclase (GGDEF)-like protein